MGHVAWTRVGRFDSLKPIRAQISTLDSIELRMCCTKSESNQLLPRPTSGKGRWHFKHGIAFTPSEQISLLSDSILLAMLVQMYVLAFERFKKTDNSDTWLQCARYVALLVAGTA